MPEGPEVTISAELLNRTLANTRLMSAKIISGRYMRKLPVGWTQFQKALPMGVEGVCNKGKFLWFVFDHDGSRGWTLWNTFGLSGKWTFTQTPHSRVEFVFSRLGKRISTKPIANTVSPIVYTPSRELIPPDGINTHRTFKMWYTDVRNFGTLRFVDAGDELKKKVDGLGIDVLKSRYKLQQFADQLLRPTRVDKTIYETLLNQKLFAGIGNYLVAEILYRARVAPRRKVSTLTEREIRKLYTYTKYITKKSYLSQGGEGRYLPRTPDSHNFKFKVYKRKVCPNGSSVQRDQILRGRSAYWCPSTQR